MPAGALPCFTALSLVRLRHLSCDEQCVRLRRQTFNPTSQPAHGFALATGQIMQCWLSRASNLEIDVAPPP